MYRRPFVILFLYFNVICITTQTVFDVTKSKKYNFNMKSAFLHNISIKIFNFLDLEQNYVKFDKSQALLTMFKRQNHIAENSLGTLDVIQNMAASNVTGTSLNLRNILEDIIREEMHHSRNYHVKKSSLNKFDKEFAVFVKIFFDKVFKISRKKVITITNRATKSPILKTPLKRTRDIKVWKPSLVEHFDLFNNTRRIYKGKKARIKDFPFLVSILINNEFASAGSIISKDLVITAATGLNVLYKSDKYEELLSSVFVRVGSDYVTKDGNLVSVIEVIFHPGYDPHSLHNNLAIVRLVRRLRYSDKRKIQRILYDKKGVFKKNSMVIILGWGAKDVDKEVNLNQKLSVARLDLFDMDKCATMYSGFYVKDSNFCAGFSKKGGGACNKDTGGPGIVGGMLAGVISFGPSVCGQAASPTVFTKTAVNVEWITSVINRERSLKIETTTTTTKTTTTTTRPETTTEPEPLFPIITNTVPANLQQLPLQTTQQAQSQVSMQINTQVTSTPVPKPPQLVSESQKSLAPILRGLKDKLKPRVIIPSHRFVTVSPDLSNISLPFSTTRFRPTLFSETTSRTTVMHPDKTLVLKEILKEIVLSNTSVIDYILYRDILEDEVEAKYLPSTTEVVDVFQIKKPEEIIQPLRSKTKLSPPKVVNSHELSSNDEADISSQIEVMNPLIPQTDTPDSNKHIKDDNNLKYKKIVSEYNIDHPDTSITESSKKNRLRNTILYSNIAKSNEVVDDFSSKLREGTQHDDYYDDEYNLKTFKHYKKQTNTKLSTTSTFKIYTIYDFDEENRQDTSDRLAVDKKSVKNDDDKDRKQHDDFSSKLWEGTKHINDDYYDNEYNLKTFKNYKKQTNTKLSTTSTTKIYTIYDFDEENRQDTIERLAVDKKSVKNDDEKDRKQHDYFSSKLREGTKHINDDYYDDEYNLKTFKHYKKQTNTKLSTTSATKMYTKYDFDEENRQHTIDRLAVDNQSDKNDDDKDRKQHNNNYLANQSLKPFESGRIGADQYSKEKGGNKKHQYHSQEKQQYELGQMERYSVGDDYNKNRENDLNENPQRFTPKEKVQIRDDKYDDENVNDQGKQYPKEYFKEKNKNKQDEIYLMENYSSDDDDNYMIRNNDHYSKRYKVQNNLQEAPDYNKNKGGRTERFTQSQHNYYYDGDDDDDINITQRTPKNNFSGVGKAAPISNDEFDYNYKDKLRENTYKTERPSDYDKPDYKQRPMTDEDEKIARYDENFERKSNRRRNYKKSNNDDDDFLSVL